MQGDTCLKRAIKKGNEAAIKFLIEDVKVKLHNEEIFGLACTTNPITVEQIKSARETFLKTCFHTSQMKQALLGNEENHDTILHLLAKDLDLDQVKKGTEKSTRDSLEYVNHSKIFVKTLISYLIDTEDVDISKVNNQGNNIFHMLAYRQDQDYKILLQAVMELVSGHEIYSLSNMINQPNYGGDIPIALACKYGKATNVVNWLDYSKEMNIEIDINQQINKHKMTLLGVAVKNDRLSVVKELAKKGADFDVTFEMQNSKTSIATDRHLGHLAIMFGDYDMLEYLIEKHFNDGIKINKKDGTNQTMASLLVNRMNMPDEFYKNVLTCMKKHGLDLRIRDFAGLSAKEYCRLKSNKHKTQYSHCEVIDQVITEIEQEIDQETADQYTECINLVLARDKYALAEGETNTPERIKEKLDHKYQEFRREEEFNQDSDKMKKFVMEKEPTYNMTSLAFTASTKFKMSDGERTQVAQILHKYGAELVMDDNGETAFQRASRKNYLELIQYFLKEMKADVNQPDRKNKMTALYFAVSNFQVEMVDLLKSHGATDDLKATDVRPLPFMILNPSYDMLENSVDSQIIMLNKIHELGYDITAPTSARRNTILHKSLKNIRTPKFLEFIFRLMQLEPELLEKKTIDNVTVLHNAILSQEINAIKLVINFFLYCLNAGTISNNSFNQKKQSRIETQPSIQPATDLNSVRPSITFQKTSSLRTVGERPLILFTKDETQPQSLPKKENLVLNDFLYPTDNNKVNISKRTRDLSKKFDSQLDYSHLQLKSKNLQNIFEDFIGFSNKSGENIFHYFAVSIEEGQSLNIQILEYLLSLCTEEQKESLLQAKSKHDNKTAEARIMELDEKFGHRVRNLNLLAKNRRSIRKSDSYM